MTNKCKGVLGFGQVNLRPQLLRAVRSGHGKASMTTNDEIRIKIATACGWSRIEPAFPHVSSGKQLLGSLSELKGTPPEDKDKPMDDQRYLAVPNYPEDLNAMNAAENSLQGSARESYFVWLYIVTNRPDDIDPEGYNTELYKDARNFVLWRFYHEKMCLASAEQRAAAFVLNMEYGK